MPVALDKQFHTFCLFWESVLYPIKRSEMQTKIYSVFSVASHPLRPNIKTLKMLPVEHSWVGEIPVLHKNTFHVALGGGN